MNTPTLVAAGLLTGALLPLQLAFNGQLGQVTKNPYSAGLVIFVVGTIAFAAILMITRPALPSVADLAAAPKTVATSAPVAAPAPVADAQGAYLRDVRGVQVDLLHWLDGAPMSAPGGPLTAANRTGAFAALGREMARLHTVSDAWTPPAGFTRPAWDRRGLLGEISWHP